jgi:hypothetical protein
MWRVILPIPFKSINFTHWFEYMMGRCSLEELEILAMVAQTRWFRRNVVIHEGIFTHPNQVFREALTQVEDFRRFNAPKQKEPMLPNDTPAALLSRRSPCFLMLDHQDITWRSSGGANSEGKERI